MKEESDFLERELMDVIKSAEHGAFIQTMSPGSKEKGGYYLINSILRGLNSPDRLSNGTRYRWSGPKTESTVSIPILINTDLQMTVYIIAGINDKILDNLIVYVNGREMRFNLNPCQAGFLLTSCIPKELAQSSIQNNVQIIFKLPYTKSPMEIGLNGDRRSMGIAISSIILVNLELLTRHCEPVCD